jgi:hypothetical protein
MQRANNPEQDEAYPYTWFWKSRLPERKGQRCRVLVQGRMNSILVEFTDGYRVVTSRYAVRKQKGPDGFENHQDLFKGSTVPPGRTGRNG